MWANSTSRVHLWQNSFHLSSLDMSFSLDFLSTEILYGKMSFHSSFAKRKHSLGPLETEDFLNTVYERKTFRKFLKYLWWTKNVPYVIYGKITIHRSSVDRNAFRTLLQVFCGLKVFHKYFPHPFYRQPIFNKKTLYRTFTAYRFSIAADHIQILSKSRSPYMKGLLFIFVYVKNPLQVFVK